MARLRIAWAGKREMMKVSGFVATLITIFIIISLYLSIKL
jgi:hypothetical protein